MIVDTNKLMRIEKVGTAVTYVRRRHESVSISITYIDLTRVR